MPPTMAQPVFQPLPMAWKAQYSSTACQIRLTKASAEMKTVNLIERIICARWPRSYPETLKKRQPKERRAKKLHPRKTSQTMMKGVGLARSSASSSACVSAAQLDAIDVGPQQFIFSSSVAFSKFATVRM